MTIENGRTFNDWLRAQLKARKMSQRQLALASGVDHSTISRLVRGDRVPSLATAARLARGLRELRDVGDGAQVLGLLSAANAHPAARVEYALRADDSLTELQVRQVMQYYHAIRSRRLATREEPQPVLRPASAAAPAAPSPVGRPAAPAAPAAHGPNARGIRRTPVFAKPS